ncbi:hypothetical protein [Fimbriimonas ginsengisoli]|uniref:hypothetical protein n=1 Tax=Fimbriimonas ginsengisoli TaxID=1005039 RepID=UPI0006976652|nr:hypothetical protein [Fimbriimonas ginsengisoli]
MAEGGSYLVKSPSAALRLLCAIPFLVGAFGWGERQGVPPENRSGKTGDPISRLAKEIDSKARTLAYEPSHGYLRALLSELHIDPVSQVLVFSKTSFQSAFIDPSTPRAIYFDGNCYVGWIPGAPNIEIITVDPELGPQFYTLANRRTAMPRFVKQTDDCFSCHDSPMTHNLPGLLTRSVYAAPDGRLLTAAGSYVTTSVSPISERWGGWYVTGKSGSQLHMGNEPARGPEANPTQDRRRGTNVTDLSRYFDTSTYLTPHSDIVSLMVLEQQTTITNCINQAAQSTRAALKYAADMLALGWERDHIDAGTIERVNHACEPLVRALLGADEPALTSPLIPSNGFSKKFSLSAPPDPQGRRLSDLDLKTRILRYPCNPMIYCTGFRGLPTPARDHVLRRLREVLSGKDTSVQLPGVTSESRAAALAILDATVH